MPKPKKLDPSVSPRAFLGAELRHQREKAGRTQDELGEMLFVSGSFIGQLEAGTRRMQPDYAGRLDELLGTDGFFARNCAAANTSKYPDHFAEAAEAERLAQAIRQFSPTLIPGLLQTEAYARAVFWATDPVAQEETIDERVAARMERTHLLDDPTTPMLWAIVHEGVLQVPVGGLKAMAEQLDHIAVLGRRHRAIVQVLPNAAGAHAALEGPIKLMTFDDAPPLSYLEGLQTGQLIDDPATVARHRLTLELLGAAALSPEASLSRIELAAEAYRHE